MLNSSSSFMDSVCHQQVDWVYKYFCHNLISCIKCEMDQKWETGNAVKFAGPISEYHLDILWGLFFSLCEAHWYQY